MIEPYEPLEFKGNERQPQTVALWPSLARSKVRGKNPKWYIVPAAGNKINGRCRLHGGRSTGPISEDGITRITTSKTIHGRFIK